DTGNKKWAAQNDNHHHNGYTLPRRGSDILIPAEKKEKETIVIKKITRALKPVGPEAIAIYINYLETKEGDAYKRIADGWEISEAKIKSTIHRMSERLRAEEVRDALADLNDGQKIDLAAVLLRQLKRNLAKKIDQALGVVR